jgi:lipoic acid synthetase
MVVKRYTFSVSATEKPLSGISADVIVTENSPSPVIKRRIPEWLTVKVPRSKDIGRVEDLVRGNRLVTVCEEARCPNLGECWSKGTATFMVMGDTCTRSCRFCAVKTGRGLPLDSDEPRRVGEAAASLRLKHVVVTSVNRDELYDGGASHFASVIEHLRRECPNTTVEVLTPDFRGRKFAIEIVCRARPDVFNHNTETVPRLYRTVRPQAKYVRSIDFLRTIKEIEPSIYTKSGIMLGLGETEEEVIQVFNDWKDAGVDAVTLGQYLKPGKGYLDVVEYLHPTRFERYKEIAEEMGFLYVASAPFVRSSYNAIDFSDKYLRNDGEDRATTNRPALPGLRRLELPLAVQ